VEATWVKITIKRKKQVAAKTRKQQKIFNNVWFVCFDSVSAPCVWLFIFSRRSEQKNFFPLVFTFGAKSWGLSVGKRERREVTGEGRWSRFSLIVFFVGVEFLCFFPWANRGRQTPFSQAKKQEKTKQQRQSKKRWCQNKKRVVPRANNRTSFCLSVLFSNQMKEIRRWMFAWEKRPTRTFSQKNGWIFFIFSSSTFLCWRRKLFDFFSFDLCFQTLRATFLFFFFFLFFSFFFFFLFF